MAMQFAVLIMYNGSYKMCISSTFQYSHMQDVIYVQSHIVPRDFNFGSAANYIVNYFLHGSGRISPEGYFLVRQRSSQVFCRRVV